MEPLHLANTNASTLPSEPDEPKPEAGDGDGDGVETISRVTTTQGGQRRSLRVELGGVEQLDEVNGYVFTAYNFSDKKKWWILSVVALCQTSMNFVSCYCARCLV